MFSLAKTNALRPALLALGGSLAIAASAQIQVPMQPVPMTMQSLVVLLVGVAYGPRLGAATLLLYLAEGLCGLPVFAGFRAGPAALMGPTGGFLLGFVPAAALAGWLAARGWTQGLWRSAALFLGGHAVLFAFGLAWLAVLAGPERAIALGLLPFLPGTALKSALGVALLRGLRRG
ncbi:biotin transporter BioY [Belnapia rosea]|jgi:biotin transport system substrate-specific component|uniref:Biotin transporter n=1 Tax=Belnapia rosea TaxID=938405 RepID=A0A1G6T1L3_9PROT|nr:biotin transporter BioY [Belnapia rosea]SDD22377.1 biotin transport system substrate-specific component [Belnapia rosea]